MILQSKTGYEGIKLAFIYTIGHICIAMTVVGITTGATLWESGIVAILEPAINGIWFYILYRVWGKFKSDKRGSSDKLSAGGPKAS